MDKCRERLALHFGLWRLDSWPMGIEQSLSMDVARALLVFERPLRQYANDNSSMLDL
jgi:hypothetical protein